MVLRNLDDSSDVQRDLPQILFENRYFGRADGMNRELCEPGHFLGEGNCRQEAAEALEERPWREIGVPDAQIRLIRHGQHYSGRLPRQKFGAVLEVRKRLVQSFVAGDAEITSSCLIGFRRRPSRSRWKFPASALSTCPPFQPAL